MSRPDTYHLTTRLVRLILGVLVLIDIVLGGVAVFWPHFYMEWVHPDAVGDPVYLLQRSGIIWLGYLVIQAIALFRLRQAPEWVLVVAFLRLIEVPADIVYLFVGDGIGLAGTAGLTITPIFNCVVGSFLAVWYFTSGKLLKDESA